MRDSKNVTAVCDLPDTQEQRDELLAQWNANVPKAQRTVAEVVVRNGGDRQAVEEMMMALGIHPDQKDVMLVNTDLGSGAALQDFNGTKRR